MNYESKIDANADTEDLTEVANQCDLEITKSAIVALGNQDPGGIVSVDNFTGTQMDRLKLASRAMGGAVKPLAEQINQVIKPEFYLVHQVPMLDDETRKMVNQPRVVIFDRNGEAYQAVSRGVYDSLALVVTMLPSTELPDDLAFKVLQSPTRNGRSVLKLEVV